MADFKFLQDRAARTILPHVLYQPPHYIRDVWNVLQYPILEWPRAIKDLLILKEPDFWKMHLYVQPKPEQTTPSTPTKLPLP